MNAETIEYDVIKEPFCTVAELKEELEYIQTYRARQPKRKDLVSPIVAKLKELPSNSIKPLCRELEQTPPSPIILPKKNTPKRQELKTRQA